jgi:hypothetical protein
MLPPAEGQHLLDQVTRTLAGTLRPVQVTGKFFVAKRFDMFPREHHVA